MRGGKEFVKQGGKLMVRDRKMAYDQHLDVDVQENIEEFDMEPDEAVSDAVKTFEMQGADLTGELTTSTIETH